MWAGEHSINTAQMRADTLGRVAAKCNGPQKRRRRPNLGQLLATFRVSVGVGDSAVSGLRGGLEFLQKSKGKRDVWQGSDPGPHEISGGDGGAGEGGD